MLLADFLSCGGPAVANKRPSDDCKSLLCTGDDAMMYFQQTFPQVSKVGKEGAYQNPAEWIVDITTKVSPAVL